MKKTRFSLFAFVVAMVLALPGCATRPDSIAPAYVSHERYSDVDCPALATKLSEAQSQLAKASSEQNSKANMDAVGVFLLGIPFSKLSGDHEGDIARLKGEVAALETAQVKGKCRAG